MHKRSVNFSRGDQCWQTRAWFADIMRVVDVTLLYLHDCPCADGAEERVRLALMRIGRPDVEVRRVLVESSQDAVRWQFRGSPTLLVNGHDPFAGGSETPALTCRTYQTDEGRSGAPTVEQLVTAFGGGSGHPARRR